MTCLGVISSSSQDETQHLLRLSLPRKTQALTASLLLGPERKPQLEVDYPHSLQRETDPEKDHRVDLVVARSVDLSERILAVAPTPKV